MTDKLKCCFCGSELEQCFENMPDLACSNYECDYATIPLPPKIWQALIDGKKAQDSLKEISRLNQYIRKELAHQIPEEASKADNSIYTITFEIAKECKKGLHNKIEEKSDGR